MGRWLTSLGLCIFGAGCRQEPAWAAADWQPPQAPQRIVAASLLATEVLLAIAPRARLAGVHELAVDGRFSLMVEAAGGLPLVGADAEQLLAVRPDLVICDAFTRPETLALLSAAAVPVVKTANPNSFDDIAGNIRHIGRLCHLQPQAEQLVAAMQERLRALTDGAAAVAAWRVINLDGGLHTYGRGSLFAAVVAAAGANPLAVERGVGPFRKVDVEALLAWQPDALVIGAGQGEEADAVVPPWIAQHPGLQLLRCVQAGRLVRIPAPLLNTTSHRLVEAAEFLQRELGRLGKP
jgi:ABC-type Fe3+-hydroxamate transport system substrate-binding protein